VEGISARTLSGFIRFSGEQFTAPSVPKDSSVEVRVPVTLLGEITGWEVAPTFGAANAVFNLILSGAGILDLHGGVGSNELLR